MQRRLTDEAQRGRLVGGLLERDRPRREPVLGLSDAREHGLGVHDAPGVADPGQRGRPPPSRRASPSRCHPASASRRRPAAGWPRWARPGRAPGRSARLAAALAEHQIGSSPAGWPRKPGAGARPRPARRRPARRRGPGRHRGRPEPGPGHRLTPPASRPAAGRWPGPGPRRGRPARSGSATRPGASVAEHDPGPAEPVAMSTPSSGSFAAHQARARSMFRRSARAMARHSGCSLVRTRSSHQAAIWAYQLAWAAAATSA